MLEMRNISFAYDKGASVLSNLQLQIHEGECIALCGRNGSGKTTITRLLMGLEKPQQGSIYYKGKNITTWSPAERSRIIGYVFQNPERQMFRPTVREEVAYGVKQLHLTEEEQQTRVAEALRETGLFEVAEAHPLNLNRSEKQRVAIASALAMKTKFFVLDEPTSGQDRASTNR